MAERLNRKFIEAKFFSPGRWIGTAYFILPPELCDRAIKLVSDGAIGSPKDYLDGVIHAMTEDWHFECHGARLPVKHIEYGGNLVPVMQLFSEATKKSFNDWLCGFEGWYIPEEQRRLREVLEKWGIEALIRESDKNQK